MKTIIAKDSYKEKYDIGNIKVCHLEAVLDEGKGIYECYECTMPTNQYNEEKVQNIFAEFQSKLKASELANVKAQKIAEIEAYDLSSEVNGFLLNGKKFWLDKATRVGLMNSTSIAKGMGYATTTLWLEGMKIVVNCDKAIGLLSALEMYALECFNVTAAHKKAVAELNTVEEVLEYDYTKGYPEQLRMEVSL